MTLQTFTALVGMVIGTSFMLLTLKPTTPREFLAVGGFLLLVGFCKVLKKRLPQFDLRFGAPAAADAETCQVDGRTRSKTE